MKRFVYMIAVILTMFMIQGCEEDSGSEPGSNEVYMRNLEFEPENLTIQAGTTVTWINKDDVNHTVDNPNNVFSSQNIGPGETFQYTFEDPGTYDVVCTIHPQMTGTVTVEPAE
jgi:plastocyanin